MSKSYKCPVQCGKRFISNEHAMSHADLEHPEWIEQRNKRKGWVTPHGFGDFQRPVTYEEACILMKQLTERINI